MIVSSNSISDFRCKTAIRFRMYVVVVQFTGHWFVSANKISTATIGRKIICAWFLVSVAPLTMRRRMVNRTIEKGSRSVAGYRWTETELVRMYRRRPFIASTWIHLRKPRPYSVTVISDFFFSANIKLHLVRTFRHGWIVELRNMLYKASRWDWNTWSWRIQQSDGEKRAERKRESDGQTISSEKCREIFSLFHRQREQQTRARHRQRS